MYLVDALVAIQPRLFVQTMCLVGQHNSNGVPRRFHIGTGALEHVIDAAFCPVPLEFLGVDRTGRAVLRTILYKDALLGKASKQIHRDNRLASSGTTGRNKHALPSIPLALARELHDALEHNLLVVDQVELGIALKHSHNSVLKTLRWFDAAVIDLVEDFAVIASLHHALNELA